MLLKKCCCVCEAIMISVIVPAYNVENYIGRTLDSILGQSFPDLEIIVVDDGSQDGTGAVIDRYAAAHPDRLTALHIPNGGVTNARLTGVSHARGEWIGFVDSDDVIEPDMYERLFENARKHNADISHCGYRMVFEDGRVHFSITPVLWKITPVQLPCGSCSAADGSNRGCGINCSTKGCSGAGKWTERSGSMKIC